MQQQPTEQPQQTDSQQVDQHQRQCQDAAADLGLTAASAVIGGGGRGLLISRGSWKLQPAPAPDPTCPSCLHDTNAKKPPTQDNSQQQQPKDLRDCKNGSVGGQCVPDKDVHKDGCYTLSKGTSCGTVCESLAAYGQCVKRCALLSCTEYLNQKSSKDLSDALTQFVADHGGKIDLACSTVFGGAAAVTAGVPQKILGVLGVLCAGIAGQNAIEEGVMLDQIAHHGGCIAMSTYAFDWKEWAANTSGFCTNG